MRKIIHGEIYSVNFERLNRLVADWSSCYRFCFCRFQKDNLKFNDVRNQAKASYPCLNTRQISDATLAAQALFRRVKNKKVIFSGRGNWNRLIKGQISKEEWRNRRDNQIYSRGDITKKQNPNIRLLNRNGDFYIRVTIGHKRFEEYKLFIPAKFEEDILFLFGTKEAYNVRLIKKDASHYRAVIDYEVTTPKPTITFTGGSIGVDANPDRVAISEITPDGNLIRSLTILNNRIFFASNRKRNYQIGCIVKGIINYALKHNKGRVFEDLRFKKEFENRGRRFNRVRSSFVWKRLITLLERKCLENAIMYRKVNPAFSSVIGKFKYQRMYNLSTHESASYIIARRGLGFNEKLSLYKYPSKLVKELVLDRAGDRTKRIHSWALWRMLRDNYQATLTASQGRLFNLKELNGNPCCKGGNPLGKDVSL